MNNFIEVLEKAKNLLNEYGWVKGRIGNREEGFCLLGAIEEVCMEPGEVESVLANEINESGDIPYFIFWKLNAITTWNDYIAKNKEQVIELINQIIEKTNE